MPTGLKEWQRAGHTLRIESWYPLSERVTRPAWHQGFVDGVLVMEGHNIKEVKTRLEERSDDE